MFAPAQGSFPVPNIQIVHASDAKAQPRKTRNPQHPFNIRSRPFEITPFMIAPVLPGETMSNLLMQSRVVSDPILNPLIGWWMEYYFVYVPLVALANGRSYGIPITDVQDMFIDPAADIASATGLTQSANDATTYTYKGAMPWLNLCLQQIADDWFRDENDVDAGGAGYIENYPGAYRDRRNGFQSLLADNTTGDDDELPGVDPIEEQVAPLTGFTTEYDKWEILRDSGLTDVTYEDYLRAQGAPVENQAETIDGVPIVRSELMRYIRKWSYPTNHVDPTDGTPTSALSYSVVERADKRRLFKHPGFLVGVTVCRPKIYLGSQKGSLVGLLKNYKAWPSVVLKDYPYTSLLKVTHSATDGPLQNQATQDYWVDAKDLYLYGDQFVNYAMAVADNHGIAFPTDVASGPSAEDRIPTLAQVKSFFVDAAGTKNFFRQDGVVHLDIKSRIGGDTTPGGG